MSNNIYDILSKLPKDNLVSVVEAEPIYESIDPQDNLSVTILCLEEKFNKFNPNDEDETKYLNPQAKRFVQLAKAKFPETSSDLEAVVASIGDKTEELDQRDRDTAEWISKAKATIGQQQREIEQTEQAVTDANARYDAQEKRFQEFNRQVAAAELDVKQQAQAALDYAQQPDAQPQAVIQQVQAQQPQEVEPELPTVVQTPGPDQAQTQPQDQGQSQGTPGPTAKKKPAAKKPAAKKKSDSNVRHIKTGKAYDLDFDPEEIDQFYSQETEPETEELPLQQVAEAVNYPEGSPALGQFNFDKVRKAYSQKLPELTLLFGDKSRKLNDAEIYALAAWMMVTSKKNQAFIPNLAARNFSTEKAVEKVLDTEVARHFLTTWASKKRSLAQRKAKFVKSLDFTAPKPAPQTPPADDKYTQQPIQPNTGQLNLFNGKQSMKTTKPLEESLMERFMNFKEAAKPDFLDLDKDGDTDEPMKKAAKDAKKHEPAEVDKDAVAKRKRLQALKDKQEDERAEKGDDDKSSSRFVKGRAYGGSAQKDDKEDDDLDESGLQAYLGKKKYGKEGMKALQQAGRDGASKEKMAMIRAKHDKMDEVAPPGAKAERMVKGIKKSLSKDGHLSNKDKAIAYATTWKARNKGQVEEATKFSDKIKNSKAELKKHKMVKEGRNAESSEYTYETIGRVLCDEQPHLDANSEAFVKAVYDELIEMKLTPKAARWLVHYDEDFISDCATSYGHFCASKEKEAMECGSPMNSFVSEEPLLDAQQELDEIAKLAGLAPQMEAKCSSCGCADCKCNESSCMIDEETINEAATRKDFRMVADLLKDIPDMAKRTELALYHADIFKEQNPRFKKEMFLAAAGVDTTPIKGAEDEVLIDEEEMGEGNEFSGALAAAKAAGEKEFEVDGKKYTVKEDININVSANGEEDVVNLIRKLSGMPVVAIQAQPAMAEEIVAEEGPKERDIEYTNTPREEVAGTDAAIPAGADLNRAKRQFKKEYPGDNPMAVAEAKEESLWKAYESMIDDVKA
jgi:hypothetical protein